MLVRVNQKESAYLSSIHAIAPKNKPYCDAKIYPSPITIKQLDYDRTTSKGDSTNRETTD